MQNQPANYYSGNKVLTEPNYVELSKLYSMNYIRENPDYLNYDGNSISQSVDLIALLLYMSLVD